VTYSIKEAMYFEKNNNPPHHIVLFCIDTSATMAEKITEEETKLEIAVRMINSLKNAESIDIDKDHIISSVIGFAENTSVLAEWCPLSCLNIEENDLRASGIKNIDTAIKDSVIRVKDEIRAALNIAIRLRASHIFIYTDGHIAERTNEICEAIKKQMDDFEKGSSNRLINRIKIHIIFIPMLFVDQTQGLLSFYQSKLVSAFGTHCSVHSIYECTNGFPEKFSFMVISKTNGDLYYEQSYSSVVTKPPTSALDVQNIELVHSIVEILISEIQRKLEDKPRNDTVS